MINDDVLRKYSRIYLERGIVYPQYSWMYDIHTRAAKLKEQVLAIKLGFKGINNNLIDLITPDQIIKRNTIIILDDNLDANCGSAEADTAPIMGMIFELSDYIPGYTRPALIHVIGIGNGYDRERDPTRMNIRPGIKLYIPDLNKYHAVIRVNSFGSGYYKKKAPKDARYPLV